MLDGDVAGGGNDTIFKDFASLRPLGVQCHALKISHLVTVPGTKKIAGRKTDVARLPKEKDKISDHAKVWRYLEYLARWFAACPFDRNPISQNVCAVVASDNARQETGHPLFAAYFPRATERKCKVGKPRPSAAWQQQRENSRIEGLAAANVCVGHPYLQRARRGG